MKPWRCPRSKDRNCSPRDFRRKRWGCHKNIGEESTWRYLWWRYHQENEELDRFDGVSDPSLVDEHRQRAALVFDQLTIGELTEKNWWQIWSLESPAWFIWGSLVALKVYTSLRIWWFNFNYLEQPCGPRSSASWGSHTRTGHYGFMDSLLPWYLGTLW